MSKTIKITLGGKDYDVPKLNIGQVREVTRLFRGEQSEISFDVLKIAFARVSEVDDFDSVEAGLDEIAQAAQKILVAAGFKRDDEKNPLPAPEATG